LVSSSLVIATDGDREDLRPLDIEEIEEYLNPQEQKYNSSCPGKGFSEDVYTAAAQVKTVPNTTADCYKVRDINTGLTIEYDEDWYDEDPLFFNQKERNDCWVEPLDDLVSDSDDDWRGDSCPLKDITHDLLHGSDGYEYPDPFEKLEIERKQAYALNPYANQNPRALNDMYRDLVRGADRR